MKFISLLMLLASSAQAMPQHWVPWPLPSPVTLYLVQAQCPGTCYPLVDASGVPLELSTAMLSGGKLVPDPVKVAAAVATQKALADALAAKQLSITNLK